MPSRIDEYEALLDQQPAVPRPHQGRIGVITSEDCVRWGITGPILRASGHGLRPAQGPALLAATSSTISTSPPRTDGDIYARYLVRVEEMRQSLQDHPPGAGQAALWARCAATTASSSPAALRDRREHGSADPPLQAVDRGLHRPRRAACTRRSNRRAASWASSWKATAAPNPTACTTARPPLPTCRSCRCSPAAISWPTWSASSAVSILSWEMQTGERNCSTNTPMKSQRILAKYPPEHKRSAVMPLLYLAQRERRLRHQARRWRISPKSVEISTTDVASIVGFYTLYHDQPAGRYRLQVCTDLPCALRGADEFLARAVRATWASQWARPPRMACSPSKRSPAWRPATARPCSRCRATAISPTTRTRPWS